MEFYHCTPIRLSGVSIKHKDNFVHCGAYMITMYLCIFIVLFLSRYEIYSMCVVNSDSKMK